jgi:two-component system, NarL family, sensor kinase
MDKIEIRNLILLTTLVFLIGAAFVLAYINLYNQRKKKHLEEKELMKLTFDAELTKTQLEVQEQTMQTIGTDLHDNIGQLLSLTSLTLNSVELDNVEKARTKIDAAIDLTVRSIKEMRLLGKLLQGDQLVVSGLSEAIRHEINWMERSGKYQISYLQEDEMPAVGNPDKDLIMFRILQEVLNNIIKHAKASEINIKLGYTNNMLQLCISDNGIGFDTGNLSFGQLGMGLQNIQKRAGIIGGEATLLSKPGEGTSVTIFIPYP